jgi:hypothetical protein
MKMFLRPEYVAHMLGISNHTLASWRKKKRLDPKHNSPDFIYMGGKNGVCRYPEKDFIVWMNSQE